MYDLFKLSASDIIKQRLFYIKFCIFAFDCQVAWLMLGVYKIHKKEHFKNN